MFNADLYLEEDRKSQDFYIFEKKRRMDNGICLNPMIPMRASASNQSEMSDQLLFGEAFHILDRQGEWLYIKRIPDQYEGWIQSLHFTSLSPEQTQNMGRQPVRIVPKPFIQVHQDDQPMWIPGGSVLPLSDSARGSFILGTCRYTLGEELPGPVNHPRDELEHIARGYLNAPYLWGGKTIFGIDCSGFTQIILRICGVELPRDSHQQLGHGRVRDFIMDSGPGDLAFFDDQEGTIVHTGIMLAPNRIIHAHGRVRIDPIDQQGIYNKDQKRYTHQLRVIKNMID